MLFCKTSIIPRSCTEHLPHLDSTLSSTNCLRQSLSSRAPFQPKPPFVISAIFTVQHAVRGPSSELYYLLTCSAMDHQLSESAVNAYSSLAISAAGLKAPGSPNHHVGITETIHYDEALDEHPKISFADHSLYGPRTKSSYWFCCRCKDGPKNTTLQTRCIECNHDRCGNCRT